MTGADDNAPILITGIGRAGQVGEAVADALARAGSTLLVVDRNEQQAHEREGAISRAGGRAFAFGCDLTDASQVGALADRVKGEHGDRLRAIVHVAGGFAMSGAIVESDLDVWQRMWSMNLITAYLVTRAFLPMVRAARGSLVYFASEAVLPGARVANIAAYAASKAGVITLMRAVAQEERAAGVRANAIAPTSIRTVANVQSMGENVHYVEREEVAAVVAFLCSEAAGAVTGQVIALS